MKVLSACRTTCTFNVSLTRPPSTSRLTSEIKVPSIRPSIFLFFLLFGFLFFIFYFLFFWFGKVFVWNHTGDEQRVLCYFRECQYLLVHLPSSDVRRPQGWDYSLRIPVSFHTKQKKKDEELKKLKRRIRRIWWKTRVPNGAAVAVKTGGYNGDQNPAVQVIIFLRLFFIILFLIFLYLYIFQLLLLHPH